MDDEANAPSVDVNPESLFKHWLSTHGGIVVKVSRAYTRTDEDRQDLAQEILLQVWRSLPQFEGRASTATWSYRVALNTALAWRRKEQRRRTRQQPVLELENLPAPDAPEAGADAAQQVAQREAIERLYAAIHRLPKTDAALVLLYLDDLSYRQMAQVLGISENNVGVKLNRAKQALAQRMTEDSR